MMAALLGEIKKLSGSAEVCGSIAYVSQQAWYVALQPTTVHTFTLGFKMQL